MITLHCQGRGKRSKYSGKPVMEVRVTPYIIYNKLQEQKSVWIHEELWSKIGLKEKDRIIIKFNGTEEKPLLVILKNSREIGLLLTKYNKMLKGSTVSRKMVIPPNYIGVWEYFKTTQEGVFFSKAKDDED